MGTLYTGRHRGNYLLISLNISVIFRQFHSNTTIKMSDKAELSRAGTMVTTAKVNIFLAYENA